MLLAVDNLSSYHRIMEKREREIERNIDAEIANRF